MAIIPFGPPTNPKPTGPTGPMPSQTDLLVAAATLHQMGRLVTPEPPPASPEPNGQGNDSNT